MKIQLLGSSVFADDFRSNYYYNQILIRDDKTIPASLTRNINSAGGQYEYQKEMGSSCIQGQ
jgi:hypothetical protein